MKLTASGITVAAVAKAIGKAGNDVGTLATSEKVNKWSRWKPVHLKNWFHPLTEAKVYEGRFGFKWDYNRTLLGRYGATLVPTVFTEDYIKPDGDATKVVEETLENVRLFKRWWYETVPTRNDFNGSNDYGRPTGEIALSNYSPARLSDFANYDHAAKPIIYSERGLERTDDGYSITLKISRQADTYGGITPNDFQPDTGAEGATMGAWYVHMFAVSKKTVTTSETMDKVYGFCETSDGLATGTMIGWTATELTIRIPEVYLSHLLGEWYIFFAVGSSALAYEASEDSWQLNDAGALAYPRLKADYIGRYVYPIENLIYLHRVPDGEGLVFIEGSLESGATGLWPNDSWLKDGEPDTGFTEVFNPVDTDGAWVQFPIMEIVGYRGLGYFSGNADEEAAVRFVTDAHYAGQEGYVSPLAVAKMLAKRAYRCLSLGGVLRTQNYLDPPNSGYKGLLRDLPVMVRVGSAPAEYNGDFTASIFMGKQIATAGTTYRLYVHIYRSDGSLYASREMYVSQPVSGRNNAAVQYVFANRVNALTNQIMGLEATARIYDLGNYDTGYEGTMQTLGDLSVTAGATVYIPYLPLFDDLHIGLPDDDAVRDGHAGGFGEGASHFGGYLPIKYSVEQY